MGLDEEAEPGVEVRLQNGPALDEAAQGQLDAQLAQWLNDVLTDFRSRED